MLASCRGRFGNQWVSWVIWVSVRILNGAAPARIFLFEAIVMEEMLRVRASGPQVWLHSSICIPYLESYGTDVQKRKYLTAAIAGDCVLALGMTEPGAGSDLANIRTRAEISGGHYVVNGSKIFISNGQSCDLVILAVKTDRDKGHKGVSLLLVETDTPGFQHGRNLEKIGLKAQDTSELFFEDCRVPVENLLVGDEGEGFKMLMTKLQQERLCSPIMSMAAIRRTLDDTRAYVKERKAFGQPISQFQNTQFKLAELETEYEIGQAFTDRLLTAHIRGDELVQEISMAKWWTASLQQKVATECLQLHGGYGFMKEYPVSSDYCNAAVERIYGGTNEIMKIIIARNLGL